VRQRQEVQEMPWSGCLVPGLMAAGWWLPTGKNSTFKADESCVGLLCIRGSE
jgi:hypothetical protein